MRQSFSCTLGGVLIAGVAAALLVLTGPKPQYTADGYDYAIMMLMDRGMPYAKAEEDASSFYATQPLASMREMFRARIGHRPEYWSLFSVRRVYPWVASLLYPYRGFRALIDVSRLAYIATAMITVVLALRFAPLPYGVLLAIVVSLFPPWRHLASEALTDALAVSLTGATLLTASACMARRTLLPFALFAGLCGLLTFTRPITYIVLGAGMIAGIAAPRRGDRSRLTTAALLTGVAALWAVAIEVALARAQAPSFRWIVADTYAHFVQAGHAPAGESLRAFFLHEEFTIAGLALVRGALSVLPVLAIAGMVVRRNDPAMPLLAGACGASWLGAILDPSHLDVVRCVVMPVAPAMAAFAAAALHEIVTRVPVPLGPPSFALRYFLPRRVPVRNHTVKE